MVKETQIEKFSNQDAQEKNAREEKNGVICRRSVQKKVNFSIFNIR